MGTSYTISTEFNNAIRHNKSLSAGGLNVNEIRNQMKLLFGTVSEVATRAELIQLFQDRTIRATVHVRDVREVPCTRESVHVVPRVYKSVCPRQTTPVDETRIRNHHIYDRLLFASPDIQKKTTVLPRENYTIIIAMGRYTLNMRRIKRLGEGSEGDVWLYYDPDKTLWYAVKVTELDPDAENQVNMILSTIDCNAISSQFLLTQYGLSYFIMPAMDGTLDDLKDRLPDNIVPMSLAVQICDIVRTQLVCIYTVTKRVYMDMKAANVLYKCGADGSIQIHIADLGSLVVIDDTYVSTYPPPYYRFNGIIPVHMDQKLAEQNLAWMIGILFYTFAGEIRCPLGTWSDILLHRPDPESVSHAYYTSGTYLIDAQDRVEAVFGHYAARFLTPTDCPSIYTTIPMETSFTPMSTMDWKQYGVGLYEYLVGTR